MLSKFARILMIISFLPLILLSSLQFIVYQPAYYERQFTRYGIEEATGMEKADLLYTMGEVMAYLAGERSDLVVISRVHGQEREIFGEREKHHMEDVRILFARGEQLRNLALLLFAAGLALTLLSAEKAKNLARSLSWSSWLPVGLGAVMGLVVAFDFSYWFVVFHQVFFDNDLWILDPSREILIQMLPEGFFADTALLTAGLTLLILLLTGTAAVLVLSRLHKKDYNFIRRSW
jgi:integral membrane protein (TIGR01906 family)